MTLGYTNAMRWAIVAAMLVVGLANARAQVKLRVAAAADLQPVMPALAQQYARKTGVRLEMSFGSSSALATQIVNGAPVDVFLGADYSFPEKIVAAGLAIEKEPEPYALGTLVVWARKDSGIRPLSVDRVTDANVKKIAIADEFHAPYGRAAVAALRWMKLYDKVRDKLVTAENVGQAAQFVETGNAQIGFISLTLASTDAMKAVGTFERVPAVYPKMRQCGVVLKRAANVEAAKAFMAWMRSAEVQKELPRFGLEAAE